MFVNKVMFSIKSSSDFAHVDQVAPLEMAVRHVNTWIQLRVSAESLGRFFLSLFRLTDLIIERKYPDRPVRCAMWSRSFTFYGSSCGAF